MFWIVDSILMRKGTSSKSRAPGVSYRKPKVVYNKLMEESNSDSDVITLHPLPTTASHRTKT